jgi:23S rRNA (adenine-N6)-dimethyltransferase
MPTLSHSQNFINNKEIIDKLIAHVDFGTTNLVIEIGPGKGIITDSLILQKKNIIAVEADEGLFSDLQKKYSGVNNLLLIQADFLRYTMPSEPFIIVSNIPFNITANIVRKITDEKSMLYAAYLIMQKDAAIKFIGAPYAHSPLLSHFLNINFEIEWIMDIDKSNYSPKPNFDTAFICFKRREIPVFNKFESDQFKDFLVYIFGCRKPLIKKALKSLMSNLQVKIILDNIKISENEEVKKVLFGDWVNIFKTFTKHAPERSIQVIQNSYKRLLLEQSKLEKVNRTRRDD